MKKSIISIAAATLLTSTVFIGCGSDSNSSTTATPPKTVKVSDGYVIHANVFCGTKPANEVDADNDPGNYECVNGYDGGTLKSKGGTILGTDAVAVNMKAPEGYSNITPLTTLLVEGLTPEELAQAFGLNTTNFDVDVVAAVNDNPDLAKAAKIAAVILAASGANSATTTTNNTTCLPGDVCTETPAADTTASNTTATTADTTADTTTADTTNNTANTTASGNNIDSHLPKLRATTNSILSLTDFINSIKSGKTVTEALNEQGATKIVEVVTHIESINVSNIADLDNDPKIKQAITEPVKTLVETPTPVETPVTNNQQDAAQTPADNAQTPAPEPAQDQAATQEPALPGQSPDATAAAPEPAQPDQGTATTEPALPGMSQTTPDTTTGPALPGMDQTATTDTTANSSTTTDTTTGPVLPGMDQTATTDTTTATDTTAADTTTNTNSASTVVLPGM